MRCKHFLFLTSPSNQVQQTCTQTWTQIRNLPGAADCIAVPLHHCKAADSVMSCQATSANRASLVTILWNVWRAGRPTPAWCQWLGWHGWDPVEILRADNKGDGREDTHLSLSYGDTLVQAGMLLRSRGPQGSSLPLTETAGLYRRCWGKEHHQKTTLRKNVIFEILPLLQGWKVLWAFSLPIHTFLFSYFPLFFFFSYFFHLPPFTTSFYSGKCTGSF